MSHGEWYGLDELGRGCARPFEAPPSVDAGMRSGMRPHAVRRQMVRDEPEPVREAFPAALEERLRATEEKLDQLLCAARALGDGMAAHDAVEKERAAALEGAEKERAMALGELKEGVDALSEQFKARISKTDYEEATLKRISDELDEHRSGLYRKIVEPLINEVIDVHQDMSATIASYRRKAEEGDRDDLAARIRRDLDEFRLMLGDILRNWNVEVWRPEPGEPLEPLRCRAVRAVPTDDRDCHRTVAESLTCGYAFEGKILRPAQVVAFTYKPKPEAESEPKPEEPQPSDAAAEAPAAPAEPGTAAADAGSSTMPEMGSRTEEHPACEPPLSSSEAAAAVAQALQGTDEACGEGEAPFADQPRCVPPAPPAPPAPRAAKAGDRLKVE
ncbi:MAG: nucleotide exchange factor GrpE [Eggerthellaceae bacterium]